jgi:uncharacterized membrane protein YkvA (DUF1232 family)
VRTLAIGIAVLLTIWLAAIGVLVVVGRRHVARELASLIPNVLRLFRDLLRDDRVPVGSKVLLALGVAWLASPIDLIPEFLPVIGPLDDAIVAGLVLRHLVARAGPEVVREHWRGHPRTLHVLLRAARISSPPRQTGP